MSLLLHLYVCVCFVGGVGGCWYVSSLIRHTIQQTPQALNITNVTPEWRNVREQSAVLRARHETGEQNGEGKRRRGVEGVGPKEAKTPGGVISFLEYLAVFALGLTEFAVTTSVSVEFVVAFAFTLQVADTPSHVEDVPFRISFGPLVHRYQLADISERAAMYVSAGRHGLAEFGDAFGGTAAVLGQLPEEL